MKSALVIATLAATSIAADPATTMIGGDAGLAPEYRDDSSSTFVGGDDSSLPPQYQTGKADNTDAPTFADVENNKVPQPDVMVYTEDEIKAWTMKHFDGKEWDSLKKNQLVSDDVRQAYVEGVVKQLVNQWSTSISGWPAVCQPGIDCRTKKFNNLMLELVKDWDSALINIDRIIGTKVAATKKILEKSWEAAYNCDDGCECEDIDVVYGHIIKTQERITTEIVTLKTELKTYIEEETEILEYCPEYADVDGSYVYKVYDENTLHYSEDGVTTIGSDIQTAAFA